MGPSAAVPGTLFADNLAAHRALFERLDAVRDAVEQSALRMAGVLKAGGKLMFCGNGGSASDCQHIAAELTGRFVRDRRPLAGLALTTDTSALTSIANDYAFDDVFSRQVEGLGRAGDCLVGISTSGNSANVLRAFEAARRGGIATIALLGRDGGRLLTVADQAVVVPAQETARIQEAHLFVLHTWCGLIERALELA